MVARGTPEIDVVQVPVHRALMVAMGRMEGQALPNGTPVNVSFAHSWTVRRGMIIHGRMYADTAVLCQALAGTRSRVASK